MMYPKTKYITDAEFERLKQEDIKRCSKHDIKAGIVNYSHRENYYSNNRKEIQRTMNYHVRHCNKGVELDYLWRGRFFVRQVGNASYYRFEDGSGGELHVTLRFYDKKTMKYIDSFESVSRFCFGWHSVHWLMNKAITEKFNVWDAEKDSPDYPYNDRTDYASIPNDWVAANAEPLNPEYNYFSN